MKTLARTLRLPDLIMLVIGTVIGSGIFIVPATVLRQVQGSALTALLVWLAGGILSLLGALTYGELRATNPEAGGLYTYLRDGFGRFAAFLYGWTLFFVIGSGSMATLAVAFSSYLGELVPLTPIAAKLVAIGMITAVCAINIRGTRQSANLQNWTTVVKVCAILLMSALLLWKGRSPVTPFATVATLENNGSFVTNFGLALISALWAYEGWQYLTFSAGETVHARRTFPRAFLIGTAALVAIYLLANLGYLAILGPAGAAESDRVAATAVAAALNPAAAKLVALLILISIFSAANGLTLTSPRAYYAMASDGLFFQRLADVHPRFETPAFAVLVGSAWAAVLALTGTFQQLLTYVIFSGWIFYALGAATIFHYRRHSSAGGQSYRVPGYPWTPLLFILAAAALVINTVIAQPKQAAMGIGIVLIGAPVYLVWHRRSVQKADLG